MLKGFEDSKAKYLLHVLVIAVRKSLMWNNNQWNILLQKLTNRETYFEKTYTCFLPTEMITHDVDKTPLQTDFIPFNVFELKLTPVNSNPL